MNIVIAILVGGALSAGALVGGVNAVQGDEKPVSADSQQVQQYDAP